MVFLNSWHQIDMVSASGGSTVDVSNPYKSSVSAFNLSTFQVSGFLPELQSTDDQHKDGEGFT